MPATASPTAPNVWKRSQLKVSPSATCSPSCAPSLSSPTAPIKCPPSSSLSQGSCEIPVEPNMPEEMNSSDEKMSSRKPSGSPLNHSGSVGRGRRRPKPGTPQNRQKHRSSHRHQQQYHQHQHRNGNRYNSQGHRVGNFATPNRNSRRQSREHYDFHSVNRSLSSFSLSSVSSGSSSTSLRASSSSILPISECDLAQDPTFTFLPEEICHFGGSCGSDDISTEEQSRYVSLDCEMVGAGQYGERSLLARVCVVDWEGNIMLDTFVKPTEPVTDYRTFVSGVRREDLSSKSAMEVDECRSAVSKLLFGKILVGHALKNDLEALRLTHPWYDIRDTAKYAPFMAFVQPTVSSVPIGAPPNVAESDCSSTSSSSTSSAPADAACVPPSRETCKMQFRPRKLRELAMTHLGLDIQAPGSEHNPVEDANAALGLYKLARVHWEREMKYKMVKIREILAHEVECY
uniref:RNA exonuclease 4 n=2 Tax=Odontella aurita TaxID=265563 RepID=A0A7S4HW81_9STRA|mmetsp:Transcript_16136/g.46551  ORF Transcript_16136/g.46551 Transcript_16136/m.46551 type:complete len:459 (+) Transcript_16136:759-2135(+)